MTFLNIILIMVFDEDVILIEYKDCNGHVIDEKNSLMQSTAERNFKFK